MGHRKSAQNDTGMMVLMCHSVWSAAAVPHTSEALT